MSNVEENQEDDVFETFHISHIHLHTLVENAKAFIPYSINFYDQTMLAIGLATDYINKSTENTAIEVAKTVESPVLVSELVATSTESPILVSKLVETSTLVDKLVATSADLLENVNDGLDSHRVQLSQAVSRLVDAVLKQNGVVKSDKDAASTKNMYNETMAHIHAALDLTKDKLRSEAATAAEEVEELAEDWAQDIPEVFEELLNDAKQLIGEEASEAQKALSNLALTASDAASAAVESVDAAVSAALVSAYVASQPLVHSVEDTYSDLVAPYVEPILHSAGVAVEEINVALTNDLLIGSYVTLAEQTAAVLIEGAKTYHLSEEEVETNFSSI